MKIIGLIALTAIIALSITASLLQVALAQTFNLADYFPFQVGDDRRFISFQQSANFTSSSIGRWSVSGTTTTSSGVNAFILDKRESSRDRERDIVVLNERGLNIFSFSDYEEDRLRGSADFGSGLLLIPASLVLGTPAINSGSFRLTGETGQEEGAATVIATAIRQEMAEVPAGRFNDVIVLEQRQEFLRGSDAQPLEIDNILTWLARGIGIIRQVEVEVDFEDGVARGVQLVGQELLDAVIGGREIKPLQLTVTPNSARFAPGQALNLALNLSNQGGNIDVAQYLVVIFPDGSFYSVGADGSFGPLRQAIIRNRTALRRGGFTDSVSIPITAQFPPGNYLIYTIFTPVNTDVYDFANWLIFEITPFAIAAS